MSFDVEILEEKKNLLIDRIELRVLIIHNNEGTPNRLELKKKISALKTSNEKLTIVKDIQTHFGATQDIAKVYIYGNAEELQYFEPFHIQVRNLPKDKRDNIYKLKKKKESYKHLFDYK